MGETGDDESGGLGPVPTRFPADEDLVGRLVAAQFPQWADLPIRRVADEGWDNRTFHLGSEMAVRLPSAAPYALAVEKEHRWLPLFGPLLPVPIPVPVGRGVPAEGYPHQWSIYRWLDGEPASRDNIADMVAFGTELAEFQVTLQGVDATEGPLPGTHNWFRGGPLSTYDHDTRRWLETVRGHMPADRFELTQEIWKAALSTSWDAPPVWFHGDMAQGNLLVVDGSLAAVIDFGTCGVGDPACDLAVAWTLLSAEGRDAFREKRDVDAATWDRGRGWALWKAVAGYAGAVEDSEPVSPNVLHTLEQIFNEYEQAT